MATKLDLGLDDIIKQNRKPKGGRGGNRGGSRGGSGFRGRGAIKGGNRGGNRNGGGIKRLNSSSPIKSRGVANGKWQHDRANGAASAPSGPARLAVSNLDFGVNDQDVNELFSRCGHIVKAAVHYDANGRSQGTADVVYRSHKEALAAVKEYNGRLLDGRAMNVQIVGGVPKPVSLASRIGGSVNGGGNRGLNRSRRGGRPSTGGAAPANGGGQRGRGGARRGGRGGRGGRSAGAPVSKEDLDKQMEEYRMQTDAA